MTSLNVLLCPKPQDVQMTLNREKQQNAHNHEPETRGNLVILI